MPLPGSHREKKVLQEIVEPEVQVEEQEPAPAVFLQEINEPAHEEVIVEEKPKRRRRSKKN
jgi:hypothetical protein